MRKHSLCFAQALLVLFLVFAGSVSAQTWVTQTSGLTTALTTVSSVNADVGWIGGNGGVVLRTTNGGTTWTNVTGAPIGTNDVYAICGLDANTCLVSTSPTGFTYVYKTTNGGTNWTQVFTQTSGFIDDIKFQNATTGFMYGDPTPAAGGRWSLWKTTNAGTTWDSAGCYLPQTGSEAGWNNAMWVSGNNIWFGTNNTKVYKSTNFGATGSWTSGVTTGSVNTYSVAVGGSIGFTGQTIALKTTDAGGTWATFTAPGTGTIYSINAVAGKFWYARGAVIYTSTDNGGTFATQYTGTGTYQAMNLVQAGSTIRGWAVSASGGIIMYNETLPLPIGWSAQTSGLTTALTTVSTVNSNVGWIGGNGGVVLRTTNGGTTWTNVTGAPIGTNDVYAICGLDANTCLVSTSPTGFTYVYKTTNGGTNWTQVFTQTSGFIDDIKFQNATTGFMYGDPTPAAGGRWSLWKTTNAGTTWDSAGCYLPQTGSEAGWNNAMWVSGNNIWFGTNNTKVYKSTNFGATGSWTSGVTTGSVNTYSVAVGGSIGFTGQTIALKTTDAGGTWATFTAPGTGTIYSINAVAGKFWYARGAVIYTSTDNGGTFATQYTGTGTYQAMNLAQDVNTIRGWAVSASGGIIVYNELLTGITSDPGVVPESYALSQNYPNPFNPSTKINFLIPKSGLVTLKIYDVLGSEVATLVDENLNPGSYTINWNAGNYSSGVYFYRLQTDEFTQTKKLMLVK